MNEVTLFRHFGTKENLAREIMHQFGGQAIAGNMKDLLSGETSTGEHPLRLNLPAGQTTAMKLMRNTADEPSAALQIPRDN